MSEEAVSEGKVWDRLSEEAKRVCSWIGRDTRADLEMLKYIAEGEENFDLTKALTELRSLGVVEEVTILQELKEAASRKPTRSLSGLKLEPPMTERERRYLNAVDDLRDYTSNPNQPRFSKWEEPRLRVLSQFRKFVSEKIL